MAAQRLECTTLVDERPAATPGLMGPLISWYCLRTTVMIEFGLPVILAVVSGLGPDTTQLHNRIHELDRRLDHTELHVAENYISKTEFSSALERVEQHMVRIEINLTV